MPNAATRLPSHRQYLAAIIGHLENVSQHRFGVGDAVMPDGYGWQGSEGSSTFIPYAVVYDLAGESSGPLGAPEEDFIVSTQITCVGSRPQQARWLYDEVQQAMLGPTQPTIPGRSIMRLTSGYGTGDIRRDDKAAASLWYCTPRYICTTTPGD